MNSSQLKRTDDEIRNRVIITLLAIFLYHLGTFIPIPNIDTQFLLEASKTNPTISNLLNTVSGGGFLRFGLFTLGILPYINASIIIQLVTNVFPQLKKLQKEEGEVGRQKLNQITRIATIVIAIFQGINIVFSLKPFLFNLNFPIAINVITCLTAGSMISLWLSEIITEKGVGNGSSLFIVVNILSNVPELILKNWNTNSIVFINLLGTTMLFLVAIIGIIILQEGIRFLPIISAQQLTKTIALPKDSMFIPFKMNTTGVLPVVIASSVLVIGSSILNTVSLPFSLKFLSYLPPLLIKLSSSLFFFLLIVLSTCFYSTVVLDPNEIAKDLKKTATIIVGVKPGEETSIYLDKTLFRLNLMGGTILGILIILPNLAEVFFGVQSLKNFGITSLMILMGAILDSVQEIRSIYFSNKKL